MNDPYRILGVPRDAPQDAVKHAYRRLAMELHPDRNPDDSRVADRFKDVNAAYGIIGDPLKRARFDRGDIDAWGRRRPRPQSNAARAKSDDKTDSASDARNQRQHFDASKATRDGGAPPKSKDNAARTNDQAAEKKKRTKPERPKPRPNGEGAKPKPASRWLGGGIKAEDLFGPLFAGKNENAPMQGVDPTHRLRVSFLEAVRGTTRRLTVGRGRTLEVAVPAGIRDGQVIRLKGQAESGPLRHRDALVAVEVTPHKHFRIEGDDIHLDVPITLEEAVLGARIKVPTVAGAVEVAVPRGTNSGATLRLRGKGLKRAAGAKSGDQMIHLVIKLPKGDDPELEDFVRRRQGQTHFDPRENLAGL